MMRGWLIGAAVCLGLVCSTELASAKVLRVGSTFATIQAAVDAAKDGDEIRVGPGAYCGATVDKRLELIGQGSPRIIGCASSPALGLGRVGFYLPVVTSIVAITRAVPIVILRIAGISVVF